MPSWYNVREGDELRRPIERWEASTISTLGHVPKVLTSRAPFVHSADGRCYRPEVCPDKTVFVPQPAPPGQRYLLEAPTNGGGQYNHAAVAGTPWCGKPAREIEGLRHRKETGTDAKYKALHEASIQSRGQGRANYRESLKTDLQATLHGQGRPVAQPILYVTAAAAAAAAALCDVGSRPPPLPSYYTVPGTRKASPTKWRSPWRGSRGRLCLTTSARRRTRPSTSVCPSGCTCRTTERPLRPQGPLRSRGIWSTGTGGPSRILSGTSQF